MVGIPLPHNYIMCTCGGGWRPWSSGFDGSVVSVLASFVFVESTTLKFVHVRVRPIRAPRHSLNWVFSPSKRINRETPIVLLFVYAFRFLYKLSIGVSSFFRSSFLWCPVTYMSSRRRLPDAKTSRRPCYERVAATVAECTDTRVRPITGQLSPPPGTRATCNPAPYPWQWSCPCRPSANHHNRHRRYFKCPTRWHRKGEGTTNILRACLFKRVVSCVHNTVMCVKSIRT